MIAIIDYGMGNLRSVQKALSLLGYEAVITDQAEQVQAARGVILPGVGAFADAMQNLQTRGMDQVIREVIKADKPMLGICLGMQLLFSWSEENNGVAGLDIIKGKVRRLPPGMKIPHMGWNDWRVEREDAFLKGIEPGSHVYFVHSYYVDPNDEGIVLTRTEYTNWFPSIVGQGNLLATQFHPEKSGRVGMRLLKNFGELVRA
ncbi:MAG: imidazole glycerol phosphate synthase subunit HisH [Methylocystaceae bacterium]